MKTFVGRAGFVVVLSVTIMTGVCIVMLVWLANDPYAVKELFDRLGAPGASPEYSTAEAVLTPGDTRDEVRAKLSGYWYVAECDAVLDGELAAYNNYEDLFFFGPRNPNELRVLVVKYQNVDGAIVYGQLYGLERDQLSAYSRCLPTGFPSP